MSYFEEDDKQNEMICRLLVSAIIVVTIIGIIAGVLASTL
jgi:hypothetical protein